MEIVVNNKTCKVNVTNSKIEHTKKHYVTIQALKWDYEKGASLSFSLPINTQSTQRSKGFFCYIYSEKATNDIFRFNFGFNRQILQYFDYVINFTGYKRIAIPYKRGMIEGEFVPYLEDFSVEYSGSGSGSLFLDGFNFEEELNPLMTYSAHCAQIPHLKKHTKRGVSTQIQKNKYLAMKPLFPLPCEITKEQIRSFETIIERYKTFIIEIDTSQYEPHVVPQDVKGAVAKYGIHRKGSLVTGKMFKNTVDVPFIKLMKSVAIKYVETNEVEYKELYVDMLHHLRDVAPSKIDWYCGRGLATSMLLMQDTLKTDGILQEWSAYLKRVYYFAKIYEITSSGGIPASEFENTDVTGTELPSLLVCILLMENTTEKVRDMQCFLQYIEKKCLGFAPGLTSGYKPDGTAFHHCTYIKQYEIVPNYALSRVMLILADTAFSMSEKAIERFRYVLETEFMIYSGGYETFSLCQYGYGFSHIKFKGLKEFGRNASMLEFAYTAKATGDNRLASMYMYFAQNHKSEIESEIYKELKSKGHKPLTQLDAHKTLTYVAAGIHRRGDDTMLVRGYSKYVLAMEIWLETMDDSSRYSAFALFRNFGFLELLRKPIFDAGVNNGILFNEGFDYRRFAGTTVPIIPLSQLKSKVSIVEDEGAEWVFSDQGFVGGLDKSDNNGIFALKLQGPPKYKLENYFANKTYHFFDGVVLCLGSNIRNNSGYEVETILFQENGSGSIKKANVLIDKHNNGYYVFANQALSYYNEKVCSRDIMDRYDICGDNTFAVLKHGIKPINASYAYVVKQNTSMEQMLNCNFENEFEIIQQDENAHIVCYKQSKNFVLFEHDYNLNDELISIVTEPCIISYTKLTDNLYNFTICDPDLRFFIGETDNYDLERKFEDKSVYGRHWIDNESMPSRVCVVLNTEVDDIKIINGNANIMQNGSKQAILEFNCKHGLTTEIEIKCKN